MNFLFWNTAGRPIDSVLRSLIETSQASFVALAEYQGDIKKILHDLRLNGHNHLLVPNIACERVTLISSLPLHGFRHKRDADRYTIKELRITGNLPLLVVVVHLPSKLHLTEDDQLLRATSLREAIEVAEIEAGHSNTVVLGDFNMNPFDKGMIAASGLNSISCARTASRGARKIDGRDYPFFYNPSWNLLGDRQKSPGTYFHRNPSILSHYWNTLDQVIVRPSLAFRIDLNSVRAIGAVGKENLVGADQTPSASDHLPIAFSIETSMELT